VNTWIETVSYCGALGKIGSCQVAVTIALLADQLA
jgi:SRSO17 transposase